jgi:hypothetical protein
MDGKTGDMPCIGTKSGGSADIFGTNGTPPSSGYLCNHDAGSYCDRMTMTCTAVKPAGQACNQTSECATGVFCDTGRQMCVAQLATGGDCSANGTQCMSTDYCDATTKKCTTRLGGGSACTQAAQCQSQECINMKCTSPTNGLTLVCGKAP